MNKLLKIIFTVCAVGLFSCSELPEYELPYDLSPTSEVEVNVTVTPENAICPGPVATFTVDAESSVYYVVQSVADDAPTSEEIWEDGESVSFDSAGSQDVNIINIRHRKCIHICKRRCKVCYHCEMRPGPKP